MNTASVYHKKAQCQVSVKEKNGSRKTSVFVYMSPFSRLTDFSVEKPSG